MLFDDTLQEYLEKLKMTGNTQYVLNLMNAFTEWIAKLERRNATIFDADHKQLLETAFIAGWNAREKEKG